MDRRGKAWAGVDRRGQAWTGVDRRGKAWTGVDRRGQARTGGGQTRSGAGKREMILPNIEKGWQGLATVIKNRLLRL